MTGDGRLLMLAHPAGANGSNDFVRPEPGPGDHCHAGLTVSRDVLRTPLILRPTSGVRQANALVCVRAGWEKALIGVSIAWSASLSTQAGPFRRASSHHCLDT
jgi:hypothetical protein